ncbi:hypothetical protein ACFOY4_40820 [Actinomadura syzygii]|uniref:hypothetical protein n=1 Tax=Actinomadura syzygii TaxID=1427538 RepID=UPI0016520DAE|nr:hypothetical protein [Actinomadura syzygii]
MPKLRLSYVNAEHDGRDTTAVCSAYPSRRRYDYREPDEPESDHKRVSLTIDL